MSTQAAEKHKWLFLPSKKYKPTNKWILPIDKIVNLTIPEVAHHVDASEVDFSHCCLEEGNAKFSGHVQTMDSMSHISKALLIQARNVNFLLRSKLWSCFWDITHDGVAFYVPQ